MDTLTHALSGALLARATAAKDTAPGAMPRRMAAGFLACAAPDLDFVLGLAGPVEYLVQHRGVTHSLLLLPLWALALSWVLAKLLREPGGWRALYGVVAMGIAAHVAGDLITSFGTMVFAPLSSWRAGMGTTFIIDLWFSGILLAGLAVSAFFRTHRWPSVVAGAVLVGYVGVQYALKQQALEFGVRYASAQGFAGARIEAHPRPVSPFNWTVFVSDAQTHRFAHVNLRREKAAAYRPGDGFIARLDTPYLPLADAAWVVRSRYGEADQALIEAAWNSEGLAFFRWFADLPAFDGMTPGSDTSTVGSTCVWFVDLRFVTPGRDWLPFQFGACRERAGASWQPFERLGPATRQALR